MAHLRPAEDAHLPFPLEEPGYRLYARARHALWHGVRALGLGPGDEVLVPAYHHGSEIEALTRASLTCRWYDGDESLAPAEDELESLLRPKVRALYLIHYMGFPQDAARWRRWCDERGLLLIEDAAQAWLARRDSRPVGALGDLAIFCLYKTIGISEGAALISRAPPPAPEFDPRFGANVLMRRHAAWLTQRSALANGALGRFSMAAEYSAARDRELGDLESGAWGSVGRLLPRLADPHVAAVRRAHYAILLDALGDRVEPPFEELPAGASPFAFPLTTSDKPDLLQRLERAGIRALDLWSVAHPSLPADGFPRSARRRTTIVGLPVHQELRLDDLEQITSAVAARARAATDPEPALEALGPLEGLREEWTRLAEPVGNIFATWEFASTWWRHFGAGGELELWGCRDRGSGELASITPLYRTSLRGLSVIRSIGHGVADQLDIICADGDRSATARALRRRLRDVSGWDLCLVERLPAERGWDALLGAQVLRRQSSPVLDIRGRTWEEFLGSLSSNLRQEVRRRERKLVREHDLTFRLAEDPDRLERDLGSLFALHDARWGGASSGFTGRWRAFHREFASVALQRGWLRLWLAEAGDETVAAWYGFRYGGSEWYYQAGRDPRFDRLSLGSVLFAHSIRAAFEDGQQRYRFLRGHEPYKRRFANGDAPVDTLVFSGGAVGRLLAGAGHGAARTSAGRRIFARGVGWE